MNDKITSDNRGVERHVGNIKGVRLDMNFFF